MILNNKAKPVASAAVASESRASAGLRQCAAAWDRFWFTPIDPFGVALLRILVGGMLLYSLFVWGIDLDGFLGPNGWNNASLVRSLQTGSYAWSFWWLVPEHLLLWVHVACCAMVAAFVLGIFTRVSAIVAWAIAVSYANRTWLSNFGLDQIICMLTMYLAITPCGQYLSVDAWIRKLRKGGANQVQPSVGANVGVRLAQLHLCVIYFFAGISKLQGESWWNGNALWQAFANYEYQSMDMTFLASYPIVIHLATHLTVFWELTFAATVWNRTLRPVVLMLGFGMHMGIGLFLGMWTFGFAMTFAYVPFVAPSLLRRLATRLRIPMASEPVMAAGDAPQSNGSDGSDGVQETQRIALQEEAVATSPLAEAASQDFTSETRSLILVCRSTELGSRAMKYFRDKYGQSVSWVSDVDGAGRLCRSQNAVVVLLDDNMTFDTLASSVAGVWGANPETCVVARGDFDSRCEELPASLIEWVPLRCNLRQVRLACEILLGSAMEKTTAMKKNSNHVDRAAVPERTSVIAGARSLILLTAVSLALSGCSGKKTDSTADLLTRAASLNDAGRENQAISVLAKAIEQEPLNAQSFYLRGVAYQQIGDLKLALEDYTRCIEIDSRNADALNNRAVIRAKLDDVANAIGDLKKAVEINPDDAVAWTNLGLAYHEVSDFEEAIRCYDEASRRSEVAQIPFQRGNARLALKAYSEAAADFSDAIKKDSDFAQAFLNRGIAYLRDEQFVLAETDLKKAAMLDTEMSTASLANDLWQLYLHDFAASRARRALRAWLEGQGWEIVTVDPDGFHFQASRLPVAGATEPGSENNATMAPDNFFGLVVTDSEQGVVCSYPVIEASQKSKLPVSLFVVKSPQLTSLRGLGEEVAAFDPMHDLVRVHHDWKPTDSAWEVLDVKLSLDSPTGQSTTGQATTGQATTGQSTTGQAGSAE